jgi:hypothetical protein
VVFCLKDDAYLKLMIQSLQKTEKLNILVFEDPSEESLKSWKIDSLPAIIAFFDIDFSTGEHKRIDFDELPSYQNI